MSVKRKYVQNLIKIYKDDGSLKTKDLSDGYHTFGELYHHRAMLFSVICNTYKDKAWKSLLHDDGTMFDGDMFIVGIETSKGQYSYHYHMEYWDLFEVKTLDYAPPYDGHMPEDIDRLLTLIDREDF